MNSILIADDEVGARNALAGLLMQNVPHMNVVGMFGTVKETIRGIEELQPDVILLDIKMPDGDGFDVLRSFPHPSFKVIFCTAYDEYAIEAFRFSALDYLLKPVEPATLKEALQKSVTGSDADVHIKMASLKHNWEAERSSSKRIVLKTTESIYVQDLEEIVYCKSDGGYTVFHLNDKSKILMSSTLGGYESMFAHHGFVRIHQSYLLNLLYLKRIDKNNDVAILKDGTALPISSRKKDHLLHYLKSL